MIFTVAQACKDWLDEHNIDQAELEKTRLQKEDEERQVSWLIGFFWFFMDNRLVYTRYILVHIC